MTTKEFYLEIIPLAAHDQDIAISLDIAINKLPMVNKKIITLYIEHFPQHEITAKTNLPQQRVSEILKRTKDNLLKILVNSL